MPRPVAPTRRPTNARLLAALTLAVPLLVVGAVEGALRVAWPAGANPLFGTALDGGGTYSMASRTIARRYFPDDPAPPAPPREAFASAKPAHAFRLFVLGESSTAGFPYPHNGAFSRVLADALRDALPGDSVEVINLGIAATNSYQMLDLVDEVIAEHPDAVLVYAGHNEFYGALGVGSTVRIASSPALVRFYLRAMRWRTVAMFDHLLRALRARGKAPPPAGALAVASFMETVAADQDIRLGSPRFRAGERQFSENLSILLRGLHTAGVSAFIASLASNVREQAPFAAPSNEGPASARALWEAGQQALAAGDTATARTALREARDLDVVRFRAPSSFNDIIKRAAAAEQAHYVPVAEAFDLTAPGGLPGNELFLEHVHPSRDGAVLIARTFFESLREAKFLGRAARETALKPWSTYRARMELTPFDERIAAHTVASLTVRWPFVPAAAQRDYRGTYRPVDETDSLALLVSRGGMGWEAAKRTRIDGLLARSDFAGAAAEARGLVRDAPLRGEPLALLGGALLGLGQPAAADSALRRSWTLTPTPTAAFALGMASLQANHADEGIRWLEQSLRLDPTNAAALYQLSLAYAVAGDAPRAKQAALALYQRNPAFPGLAQWLQLLGLAKPK
jgi:lysophospholipase L1-like esterase